MSPRRSSRAAVTGRSRSYSLKMASPGAIGIGLVALACTLNVPVVRPAGSIGPSREVRRVTETTCSPPSSTSAFNPKATREAGWPPARATAPGTDRPATAPAPAARTVRRLTGVAMGTPSPISVHSFVAVMSVYHRCVGGRKGPLINGSLHIDVVRRARGRVGRRVTGEDEPVRAIRTRLDSRPQLPARIGPHLLDRGPLGRLDLLPLQRHLLCR